MYRIIGNDQREYGPVSADEVKSWIAARRANGRTAVRLEDGGDWKTLAELPEFADALKSSWGNPAPTGNRVADAAMARQPILDIGDCFSRGWKLLQSDLWFLVGVTALMIVISLGVHGIPLLGQIAAVALFGPIYAGWDLIFLKRLRGEPAVIGDLFWAFGPKLVSTLLAGALYTVLSGIGLLLFIIPGLYLMVAWWFSIILVVDKGLDFWPAMEASRRVVTANFFTLLLLFLLVVLISFAGLLLLIVGAIFTSALGNAVFVCAYEDLFGSSRPPAQTV